MRSHGPGRALSHGSAPPELRAPRVDLLAGEVRFGGPDLRIVTLLGSCVAITAWHPRRRVGGMCHFVLPSQRAPRTVGAPRDARYADEAVDLLLAEMTWSGAHPREYEIKLFGGGRQFSRSASPIDVGPRNVEAARHLLDVHGLVPVAEHVGGSGRRNVVLDTASGDVWVRHVEAASRPR